MQTDVEGLITEGKREIVGLHIGPSEAEIFWSTFVKSLVKRGLRGTKLASFWLCRNRDAVRTIIAQARVGF